MSNFLAAKRCRGAKHITIAPDNLNPNGETNILINYAY